MIINGNIADIMRKCKLDPCESEKEVHQISKKRYLIYSEETISTVINCQQPVKEEMHFNKTIQTKYLYELTVPAICDVETENAVYLGEPITLMSGTVNRESEFKLIVQNLEDFRPEEWLGILGSIERLEKKTAEKLWQDIKDFKFDLMGEEKNATEKLLMKLTERLMKAKSGIKLSQRLLELIRDPWIVSYGMMAVLVLSVCGIVGCLMNKIFYSKSRLATYHRSAETYEMLDNNTETTSLVSVMRSRLGEELIV